MRSGRVSRQWTRDKSSFIIKDFVTEVVELGSKKRYLTEPAVAVVLDLVRKVRLSSTHKNCFVSWYPVIITSCI